jgi:membrane-associated phospholipid phosphatase
MGLLKKQNTVTFVLLGYLVAVVALMIFKSVSITPDRFIIFIFFGAVLAGRGISFVKDWAPFLGLLLGYEMLRGFADDRGLGVQVESLVNIERSLFGFIPTERLQDLLYTAGRVAWYDWVAVVTYFLHFPLPLMVAFFLWLKDKAQFNRFIISLLILSFAGFITFLLLPAAPPWYAAERGLIETEKIINIIISQIGWSWNLSYFYDQLNPNPVAAMPSLHAAYPWLSFLALRNFSKKIAWFFLPYPILVWFSIVYLGEHYVIDVIAGVAYAQASFLVVYKFSTIKKYILTNYKKFKGSSK